MIKYELTINNLITGKELFICAAISILVLLFFTIFGVDANSIKFLAIIVTFIILISSFIVGTFSIIKDTFGSLLVFIGCLLIHIDYWKSGVITNQTSEFIILGIFFTIIVILTIISFIKIVISQNNYPSFQWTLRIPWVMIRKRIIKLNISLYNYRLVIGAFLYIGIILITISTFAITYRCYNSCINTTVSQILIEKSSNNNMNLDEGLFYGASRNIENLISTNGRIDYLYFSSVTFFTLGYGDILPLGKFFKISTQIEVIINHILVAIFLPYIISLFNNKKKLCLSRFDNLIVINIESDGEKLSKIKMSNKTIEIRRRKKTYRNYTFFQKDNFENINKLYKEIRVNLKNYLDFNKEINIIDETNEIIRESYQLIEKHKFSISFSKFIIMPDIFLWCLLVIVFKNQPPIYIISVISLLILVILIILVLKYRKKHNLIIDLYYYQIKYAKLLTRKQLLKDRAEI